jgi:hypothetical protein
MIQFNSIYLFTYRLNSPEANYKASTRRTKHTYTNKNNNNNNNNRIAVAEWSKAWIDFTRSDAVIVRSNPSSGMDVWCMCCVCEYLCFCTGRGLCDELITRPRSPTDCPRSSNWSETETFMRRSRSKLGCRAKEGEKNNNTEWPKRRAREDLFKLNIKFLKISGLEGQVPLNDHIRQQTSRRSTSCGGI